MDEQLDYRTLGLKIGLEIHQQLDGHKLFCKCPPLVNDDHPVDIRFSRRIRASAGEAGGVDVAASFEQAKELEFFYEGCSTSSCLVELDEEPPHPLNEDVLKTALVVSTIIHAIPVPQIQIMRKIVVDGSNVSGFQRTMLVATDGYIETSKGRINIPTVCLEEESAKKIAESKNGITYRLDRLGVPLIEIATDASIKDPEHAKEAASLIGMILRSTGRVKRGIGSIRQDVNLSIKGHPRVEIKGFQDLRSIVKTISFEISRQQKAVGTKEAIAHVRKANPDGTTNYLRPMPGAERMYVETDIPSFGLSSFLLTKIKLPELISEKTLRFEKEYCIPADLARELVSTNTLFEKAAASFSKIPASFLAQVFVSYPKEIRKRVGLDSDELSEDDYFSILLAYESGEITKEAVFEAIVWRLKHGKVDLSNFSNASDAELSKAIQEIVQKNKRASFGALMGEVMKRFRGRVDGKKVSSLLKKALS